MQALLRGARTRILAAFVTLLAFSTVLSVLAIRQLLLVRTADRVDAVADPGGRRVPHARARPQPGRRDAVPRAAAR